MAVSIPDEDRHHQRLIAQPTHKTQLVLSRFLRVAVGPLLGVSCLRRALDGPCLVCLRTFELILELGMQTGNDDAHGDDAAGEDEVDILPFEED
jgi:hypothetical protein